MASSSRRERSPSSPVNPEAAPPWNMLKVTTRRVRPGGDGWLSAAALDARTAPSASPAIRRTRSVGERLASGGQHAPGIGNMSSLARKPNKRDVPGRHPADGSFQREEGARHDRRGDLGTGPEAAWRLVNDDRASGLLHRGHDRLAIEG